MKFGENGEGCLNYGGFFFKGKLYLLNDGVAILRGGEGRNWVPGKKIKLC